jgi:hypothetical protein
MLAEHCKSVSDESKCLITTSTIQSFSGISNTEVRLAISDLIVHNLVHKDNDSLTIDYKKVSRITKLLSTINMFGTRLDQRVQIDIAAYCMSKPKCMATIPDILDNVHNGTQLSVRLFQMHTRKSGKMFTYEQF